jgi:hypothetical protein
MQRYQNELRKEPCKTEFDFVETEFKDISVSTDHLCMAAMTKDERCEIEDIIP